jgi:cobalt-zinc-cadmium efflux system outer membrane protein
MKSKVILGVLVISVFLHIRALAEEEVEKLSLEETMNLASNNNPEMVMARRDIQSAKARVIQAMAYPNPGFEIGARTPLENVEKRQVDVEVGVSQELDILGKRKLLRKIAENEVSICENDLDLIWIGVSLEIKEAYAQVLLEAKTKELAEEVLNLTQRFLDGVHHKYNLGGVLRAQLLRAEIEVLSARNGLLIAEKELFLAKGRLNISLGRPASQEFDCINEFTYAKREFDLNDLVERALIKRPDLKAKRFALDSKRLEQKLARKEIFASPCVSFSAEREDGEQKLGVGLGIPLPLWYRKQGEIAEVENELQKMEHQIGSLQRQIELEVSSAFYEISIADRQAALMERSVKRGGELVSVIEVQYAEGKTDFLTYLETLTTFRETKLSHLKALLDYQTKLAILEKAIGGEL